MWATYWNVTRSGTNLTICSVFLISPRPLCPWYGEVSKCGMWKRVNDLLYCTETRIIINLINSKNHQSGWGKTTGTKSSSAKIKEDLGQHPIHSNNEGTDVTVLHGFLSFQNNSLGRKFQWAFSLFPYFLRLFYVLNS